MTKKHKKSSIKKRVALVTAAALALSTGGAAWAANVSSTFVKMTDTAIWVPASPDPSGIAYIPSLDKIVVSDAEVDEIPAPQPGQYKGANLYTMGRDGVLAGTGTTKTSGTGWSVEPTGVTYNPNTGSMFVVDDDKKSVFEITNAGTAGVTGTIPTTRLRIANGFKTTSFNNTDPEGIAYDPTRNELLLVNGQTGARFYRLQPGPDGIFNGISVDDVALEFDLTQYGVLDPEGIAYDPVRDTILVSSDGSQSIFELDQNGALLNVISLASIYSQGAQNAADVVIAPSSTGTGQSYFLPDRGLDNNSHPAENDGRVWEVRANMPAITNFPPVSDAGVDQMLDLGETVTVTGAVRDKDATDTHTFQWTATGPGPVTFATPNLATTTATFSVAGDYVFTLRVTDSKGAQDIDAATIRVFTPGAARDIAVPIQASSDDAQEGGGSSGTFVDVDSPDDELGNTGGANPANVLTGFRFANLPIPAGSEITRAQIQFKVDEAGLDTANFTFRGEASDNASTYLKVAGNISARPSTTATVGWQPPPWQAPAQPDGGASGPDQLTPDLKTILQEIVSRPGWQKGNAAAFMVSGTGRRTAEGKDGLTPPVLMLGFKSPAANTAPVVNAGPDRSVNQPYAATLDGTVTDDLKPGPTTTAAWSMVSGPGTVTFADAAAVDTTATFSTTGSYVLRLTANDSLLTGQDDVTVVVAPNPAPVVDAGPTRNIDFGQTASLNGTATDDGQPGPLTVSWSKASGPGDVTFANPAARVTTATFSVAGDYVLRLTASDTGRTSTDTMQVKVKAPKKTAQLTVTSSSTMVTAGGTTTLTGTVAGAEDGQTLTLQRSDGGAWVDSGTARVTQGTASAATFTVTSSVSGAFQYRLVSSATATADPSVSNTVTVLFYRARIVKVIAGKEVVKLKNTGAVAVDLKGWVLKNKKNGKSVRLPSFTLQPGAVVRIHTGDGATNAKHLFLDRKDMWGAKGKAVLKDGGGSTATSLRY